MMCAEHIITYTFLSPISANQSTGTGDFLCPGSATQEANTGTVPPWLWGGEKEEKDPCQKGTCSFQQLP